MTEQIKQKIDKVIQDIYSLPKESKVYWELIRMFLNKLVEEVQGDKVIAFIQGAQWWEFISTKFTMWQSDRNKAENEAIKRLGNGTLGKPPQIEKELEAER